MKGSALNDNVARRLYFVRHGQSVANAAQVIAGSTDVALTEKGRYQAAELAPVLAKRSFKSVWSSDLSRAVDTARLAGFEPVQDPRVRELDFGDLEGRPWGTVLNEHKADLSEFATFEAPNGESVPQMVARIEDFAGSLPSGDHLVFCHGGVIRIALARVGVHRFVDNCTLVGIDWDRGLVLEDGAADTEKGAVS